MASPSPFSSPRRPRSKALALMEIVSDSTPTRMFAPAGQCHRISAQAKKYRELHQGQVGVKRTLVQNCNVSPTRVQGLRLDPGNLSVIEHLIKSAVQDALKEEREKVVATILSDLETGVLVRRLITDWEKSQNGKHMLGRLGKAVDTAYIQKRQDLPYAHRVFGGDLLADIKRLIRMRDTNGTQASTAKLLLDIAKKTIKKELLSIEKELLSRDVSSHLTADELHLTADELIDLAACFLRTNQLVHEEWTEESIQQVIVQAQNDELPLGGTTPKAWIVKMALDIAKSRGWSVNTR